MVQVIQLVDPKANTLRLFTPRRKKQKREIVINEKAPYSKYRFDLFLTKRMITPAQAIAIWHDEGFQKARKKWLKNYHEVVAAGSCPNSHSKSLYERKITIAIRDKVLKDNNLPPIV